MKDSGIPWIGEIPKEWNVSLIASCIKEVDCKNTDGKEDNALQFKMGTIISKRNGDSKYNPETLEAYNIVKVGDIIINGLNLSFDLISQRVGLVKENGVITSTYIAVRPTINISNEFLTYLFKAYDNCKAFHSMGRGLRQTLSYGELRKYYVVLPLKEEQQRIAEFLDRKCVEIDEAIALQEEFVEELKAYKQSLISETISRGLNPNVPLKSSGIKWIEKIPKHWNVCRFKDVASVKANLVHPDDYLDYPQIAPDNIEKGSGRLLLYKSVKESNVISDNHLFYKGQIVYSKIRPVLNKLIIAPFDGLCSADMYPIETRNDINYQKYYMLSEMFVSQVALVVQDRVKMPKINKDELGVVYALSLPLSEQHQIANYLDEKCAEIDSLIAIKQQKIEELKEYKKSIIYEYVTGKKEVDG